MVNAKGINGGPQLTWANVVITLALIATAAGGGWMLFQNQFQTIQVEMRQADSQLAADIKENQRNQENLRDRTILRTEHTEMVKRLDMEISILRDRLAALETTRPTTGELQSVGAGTRDQISEIKERVRSLEDNLRRPAVPYTPVPNH